MSEYWVSRQKYYCKYCEIYIADDAPSRQQHESGLRHKGNTERFIRNLYKTSEKRKKDLDEEKREMARVEQAAQAAYAQDVGAGRGKAIHAAPKPVASSSKPPQKPSNPYANYSTAASLGYTDPDAEKIKALAQQRQTEGVVGAWEFLPVSTPAPAPEDEPKEEPPSVDGVSSLVEGGTSRKREADTAVDEEDSRQFKVRKKVTSVGLGELYDPGIIPIKLKTRDTETPAEPPTVEPQASSSTLPPPELGAPPKWTPVQWKKAADKGGSTVVNPPPPMPTNTDGEEVTGSKVAEEIVPEAKDEVKEEVKEETPVPLSQTPTQEPASGLFRKRKIVPPKGKARA